MSQKSRQQPATSSNNLESAHEPKGPVGRPRNDHGVPTETRKDPLWRDSRPTGYIITQLSNMGQRKPHFEHFTQKEEPAKRLSREHYLKERYFLLGELDYQLINNFKSVVAFVLCFSLLCKRLNKYFKFSHSHSSFAQDGTSCSIS